MEMAVKSMEMVVEAMESMETAPGALPRPARVSEQRILSPKIGLRWRRRYGTLSGKTSSDLGFSRQRLNIGGGAISEGTRVAHTIAWRGLGGTRALAWCGQPPAPLHLCYGLRLVSGKIGTSGFVSSNFENIFCITFLNTKTAENRELALEHLVNRLVPENA
jgi:hypothetical protein